MGCAETTHVDDGIARADSFGVRKVAAASWTLVEVVGVERDVRAAGQDPHLLGAH